MEVGLVPISVRPQEPYQARHCLGPVLLIVYPHYLGDGQRVMEGEGMVLLAYGALEEFRSDEGLLLIFQTTLDVAKHPPVLIDSIFHLYNGE